MTVYDIDPIQDPRWRALVEASPKASIFHSPGWLEALQRTYGYRPVVFTTTPPESNLKNGVVLCRVKSWLTGRRVVSLPFSDHCEPLVDSQEEFDAFLAALQSEMEEARWAYLELRPLTANLEMPPGWGSSEAFHWHRLNLQPSLEDLFRNFHKDSTQRKVRRAEREGLTYSEGASESILKLFYGLLVLTRRRHQLPPQPYSWFRNLIDCMGDALKIRIAYKDGQPIASILSLAYKNTMVYKYGCSDPAFHQMGGMHLLFWKTIQEAKERGLRELDFGRSEWDNHGLVTFKDRWGATRSTLTYYRYPAPASQAKGDNWKMKVAKQVFGRVPDGLLTAAGKFLYRHMG